MIKNIPTIKSDSWTALSRKHDQKQREYNNEFVLSHIVGLIIIFYWYPCCAPWTDMRH